MDTITLTPDAQKVITTIVTVVVLPLVAYIVKSWRGGIRRRDEKILELEAKLEAREKLHAADMRASLEAIYQLKLEKTRLKLQLRASNHDG